jgi:hypothetical protein
MWTPVAVWVPVPEPVAERTLMWTPVAVCVPTPEPVAVLDIVAETWLYVVVADEYRMSDWL